MDLSLINKIALVTGASKGIGAAIAHELAREGADIAICAREPAPLEETAHHLTALGRQVVAVAADLATTAGVQSVVDAALARFGRVDILVNNVGGAGGPGGFMNLQDEHWQRAWDLNVMAAVRFSRALIPGMVERRWGRIINIGSTSGREPDVVVVHYNCAKAGLLALSKTLANTYSKDGVLVNCVLPGLTHTPALAVSAAKRLQERGESIEGLTPDDLVNRYYVPRRPLPIGRVGRPDDLAGIVAFLASDRAAFITGAAINVDGGWVKSIY
ncbi:MAG TPA: SDR family NAD(P)-dependent oxidoreductase [Candidatus Margulisiibacteriota bacterium]|nr:SDR family NAD(P)-dependent oxidoreductase [Candidatus Margulisiibacteriota bacterium]